MNPPDNSQTLSQISETIAKGNSGVIILPMNPTVDAIAAGTGLYLGLNKLGKNVALLSATSPQSDLAAADKIQTNFATKGDNLVISFPYVDGAIDKVDYNITGGFFNLIITPRPDQTKLEPDKVQYSYTGGKIDFIITVDAPNLNSLGTIYTENQKEFQGKTIINIDRHLINNMFGTINFVNKTSSSTSELVVKVLLAMKSQIDKDMATNLYAGLTAATNHFSSYSVNADTFEAASVLLKQGAFKRPQARPMGQQPGMMPGTPMRQPFPTQMTPPPMPMNPSFDDEDDDFEDEEPQQMMPPLQNQNQNQNQTQNQPSQPPQEWLKPKIFKGGGGLL